MERRMNPDMNTIRLLGAAQLFVFVASMLSEQLLRSVVGSGNISDILVNISKNISLIQISNLVALVNSLGIVTLGVLFYIVLNEQNKILALVALGCFLAEAITLAVSKIGAYALIPISRQFVAAGSPEPSYLQTLGDFLYKGVDRRGYDIHMLFFCVGGILWYYLLNISRSIPQVLSVWGLAAICLLTIPTLLALLDLDFLPAMILGLPYVPFELVLGIWLIVKGFN
jgi:hypothetical protein